MYVSGHRLCDVQCPLSGAKRVFVFFPPRTDERTFCDVGCVRHRSSDLKCPLSGAITLMLHDVLK